MIKVGISQMDVVFAPDSIRTSGLGSCVGVVLYDSGKKVAGMAHVMLPDSTKSKLEGTQEAKYADTAIPALYKNLVAAGGRPAFIKAKIAGGSQMFNFTTASDVMKVGPRNVEAIKTELSKLRIPLVAENTGGNFGRTIEFYPESAILSIRTATQGVVEI